ncbi:hypothetical protein DNHGIG_28610 [Collibacillus ludicampi]|jgi:hypothetical protein|uniref:Uncharacterized protein n=1 Tax=Collibacillus ludicampi TaxID=2771369 RepID=A0AAV4LHM2_9BACL|nr:hypothetical protein [Collibacillus ludicampi]GIM47312.1 hypothetical protein DNHGIG_28610 [Collibacillus ludicampi]
MSRMTTYLYSPEGVVDRTDNWEICVCNEGDRYLVRAENSGTNLTYDWQEFDAHSEGEAFAEMVSLINANQNHQVAKQPPYVGQTPT